MVWHMASTAGIAAMVTLSAFPHAAHALVAAGPRAPGLQPLQGVAAQAAWASSGGGARRARHLRGARAVTPAQYQRLLMLLLTLAEYACCALRQQPASCACRPGRRPAAVARATAPAVLHCTGSQAEIAPGGNAAAFAPEISVGDELVATNGLTFTTEQVYNDNVVRGGAAPPLGRPARGAPPHASPR